MKQTRIIWLCAAVATLFTACSDDDLPAITPSARGTVTDDLGNTYNYVRIGNQEWTTSNAKNGTNMAELTYFDGWDYADAFSEEEQEDIQENYLPVYGNLMTYEEAVASAPEGWRLPSDADWQQLERTLGMKHTERKGWRGNEGVANKLMETGMGTELALKIGGVCTWKPVYGWMELELDYVKEYGYYWTSTIEPAYTDNETAYYRKLCFGQGGVERQCGKTDKMMSVRWVRDVQ